MKNKSSTVKNNFRTKIINTMSCTCTCILFAITCITTRFKYTLSYKNKLKASFVWTNCQCISHRIPDQLIPVFFYDLSVPFPLAGLTLESVVPPHYRLCCFSLSAAQTYQIPIHTCIEFFCIHLFCMFLYFQYT